MYKSILLPLDLEHKGSSDKAVTAAILLAKLHDAKIHLLSAIPDYGMAVVGSYFPKDFAEKALSSTEKELDNLAAEHIPNNLLAGTHTARGTVYQEIISAADKLGCDLIVMGSHRPEMSDYLLGPNASRVVRHAKQSVFIVR